MAISNCNQCNMQRICRKDNFSEVEEKELLPCFRPTEQIREKAQQQISEEIINWIKYDLDKTITDTAIKIITFVNAATLIANVIGIIIRLK